MKTLSIMLIASLLLMVVGCEDRSSTVTNATGGKLTLTAPGDVSIQRGEMAEVTINIKRENLAGPVTVRFNQLPAGVTLLDSKEIVGNEGRYNLKAAADAALVVNHQAQVTATGGDGVAVTKEFKISVTEK